MSALQVSIIIPSLNYLNVYELCRKLVVTDLFHYSYEIIPVIQGQPEGYVIAANQGLRAARGEYKFVLNDDITGLAQDWIETMFATSKEFDIVSSAPYEDEGFAGWCVMFSPKGYTILRGFDPKYIHWQADVDLLERCEIAGLRWTTSTAAVSHDRSNADRAGLYYESVVQEFIHKDHETRLRCLQEHS